MSIESSQNAISRRAMLKSATCGFGTLALSTLLNDSASAATDSLVAKHPHFPAKAKRVIFLFLFGGPSHVDMFDYKPRLKAESGNPPTFKLDLIDEGLENAKLLGPLSGFRQVGQAGLWMTDRLPYLAQQADELCILKAMHTDTPAHATAINHLYTGTPFFVWPSMGAWVLYGLGTENQNVPGFITVCPIIGMNGSSPKHYGSAFLPAIYQGTPIGNSRTPASKATIRHLANTHVPKDVQAWQLEHTLSLNQRHHARVGQDSRLDGLIRSFELAFRMQSEVPDLLGTMGESKATLELYGIDKQPTDNFGRQCLMARRFLETGVRFVQVSHPGWDAHSGIIQSFPKQCAEVDKPIAGLLADLKMRGMLDDTLVICAGEFGRTPYGQDLSDGKNLENIGRAHNRHGYSVWLAGGGVKGGMSHGETDDYGHKGVVNRVHVHDFQATILHLLGLNHEKLTYRHSGRDYRLTDVHGSVVSEILA